MEIQDFLSKKANILIEAALLNVMKTSFLSVIETLFRYFEIFPRYFIENDEEISSFKRKLLEKRAFLYSYDISSQRQELNIIHRNCAFLLSGLKTGLFQGKQWVNLIKNKCFPSIFSCKIVINIQAFERKKPKKSFKEREKARDLARKLFKVSSYEIVTEILRGNEELCNLGDFEDFPMKFKVFCL